MEGKFWVSQAEPVKIDLFKINSESHCAKIDLNKKWLPKKKTVQNFNIDAKGFRKARNENPPTQEIGVIS